MAGKARISDISELIGIRIVHTFPGYGAGQISDAYLTVDSEIYVIIAFDNGRKANPFSLIPCMCDGRILLENSDYSLELLDLLVSEKEAESIELIEEIKRQQERQEQLRLAEERRKLEALQEEKRQAEKRRIEFEKQRRIREELERLENERRQALIQKAQEEQRKRLEELEMKKRLLEEQRQAEIAARLAKKNELIQKINSVFESDYLSSLSFFRDNNTDHLLSEDDFFKLQESYTADWFSTHKELSQVPDKDQISAISSIQKNIEVVARAGSGKTTTIVNRFHFLVDHCGVDPSSVLMLAFNKKAVDELRDRTDQMLNDSGKSGESKPHILTFHALAYSIVQPAEKLVFDEGDSGSNELSRTVQAIINKRLKDTIWLSRIQTIMLEYFRDDWEKIVEGGFHLSKQAQLSYRRSLQNQSLNGDYVKSYGEKLIANILFEHDIDYAYEKPFKWDDGYYRPDFTIKLPKSKWLIIEYFGLAGKSDYDEQIIRKRQYWSWKENYILYELYPADIAEGEESIVSKLRELFEAHHVSFNKLSDEEIWKRIEKRAIYTFTKTVTSFIGRCRKKDLSIDELREMVNNYQTDNTTEKLFLSVCGSIYKEYLHTLSIDHLEDFDGLISRACICIACGKTDYDRRGFRANLKDLSFIMIDEYQDFSYLFDKLLNAVRSVCPDANIFCVGDDWQAINGFAGSDVSYFQDFVHRYDDSAKYAIRTNYRSARRIVNAGTSLMSCGAEDEAVRPYSTSSGNVAIAYYDLFDPSYEEQDTFQADLLTPAILRLTAHFLRQDKQVVFLFRTKDRLPINAKIPPALTGFLYERFTNYIKSFFPTEKRDQIKASTTHQYKGKESDAVIIIDAMTSFYPLIHPTWIFMRIFGDGLDKLIEDERRLFYVAVTRAKSDLVILTTIQDESPFLGQLSSVETLQWSTLPAFDTGKRKTRIEVSSQCGFKSTPTYSIRKELRDSGFDFDRKTYTWFRFCEASFDLQSLIDEPWVSKANHIQVTFYDEHGKETSKFLLIDGETEDLMPKDFSANKS